LKIILEAQLTVSKSPAHILSVWRSLHWVEELLQPAIDCFSFC